MALVKSLAQRFFDGEPDFERELQDDRFDSDSPELRGADDYGLAGTVWNC